MSINKMAYWRDFFVWLVTAPALPEEPSIYRH